jgi:hypothetical protein
VYDAEALAAHLDVDLDHGVCWACLSFVSFAMDGGDEREVRRQLRRMTPGLWTDGLDEQVLGALARANECGSSGAGEGLAEVQQKGGRSALARAVVRRLAEELNRREQRRRPVLEELIGRRREAQPELN